MGAFILFLLSVLPLAYGAFAFHLAGTVFQQIAGAVFMLIGTILFSAAFVVSSVDANRRKTIAALKRLESKVSSLAGGGKNWPGVRDD